MSKKEDTKAKEGEMVDSPPPAPIFSFSKDAKATISNGLVSLNTTLFGHAIKEAQRVDKIRNIVEHIENKVLDQNVIDSLPPTEQIRIMESLRRSMDNSILFLERLQRGSIQLVTIMQIYEMLVTGEDTQDSTVSDVGIADKQAVASLKGELIDLIARKKKKLK